MQMRRYKIKKADLEVNLAPLIDVIFLLLIFFMVASTLNADEIRATIQLPQVDMQTEVEKNPTTLYLDKSGKISVQDNFISWDMLQDYLREKPEEKLAGIEIYADKEVDFEYVARLMTVASKLKIELINFCLEYDNSEEISFGR
jgi:biopolymer transport protein ExbD